VYRIVIPLRKRKSQIVADGLQALSQSDIATVWVLTLLLRLEGRR
jgi:hypothetical protein